MHRYIAPRLPTALVLLVVVTLIVWPAEPTAAPPLAGFDRTQLLIRNDTGTTTITARVADDPDERAQGMQHLAPEAIRANPIWFVFPRAQLMRWHMRNVAVPLDIAFVDENGRVLAVTRMEPGKSGYGIDTPVRYALELAAGQAAELGIRAGTRIAPAPGRAP